jgi:hypothetical protein
VTTRDTIWAVLDIEKVQACADRIEAPTLYRNPPTKYSPFDILASHLVAVSEAEAEKMFLKVMNAYLQNRSAEGRWLLLNALSTHYSVEFLILVKYLRERGVPTRYLTPAADRGDDNPRS